MKNKNSICKLLCFLLGAFVSFCVSGIIEVTYKQCGISTVFCTIPGILCSILSGYYISNDDPDFKDEDILFSFFGGTVPTFVNAIGLTLSSFV